MSDELCYVKKITLNKELRFGKYSKVTGDPKVMETMKRSWKRSWNLITSKEYKPCLFGAFTLSLTIQIGKCPEAPGSLFCSVTMHVIPYCNIWTPDQSWMEVDYAFRKQRTIQSAILYSRSHPRCIRSLGYTGSPIYNHHSYSLWFHTQQGLILGKKRAFLIFCFSLKELLLLLLWNLFLNKIWTKYTRKAHK